ncbi:MAG: FecR family protein, partial [Bryobacteraceae bacterium]|nr:FecR family protein [Bryobacteraceae bacterium]
MLLRSRVRNVLLAVGVLALPAAAQNVISAKAGLIHYTEGAVTVDGQQVEAKLTYFPEVKQGQTLATAEGRAEVLLTPGSVLRVGENSSIRMLSTNLADARVEILSGDVLVEANEILEGNAVTLISGSNSFQLLKAGLYRVDLANGRIRVYNGEARLVASGQTLTLKKGQEVATGGVLMASKFDTKTGDSLYRWGARRSEQLALTNVAAAREIQRSGFNSGSMIGGGWNRWFFNPWFGSFTFIPVGRGVWVSPFGYTYFSPWAASQLFIPTPVWGGGGFGGGGRDGLVFSPNHGYDIGSRGAVL